MSAPRVQDTLPFGAVSKPEFMESLDPATGETVARFTATRLDEVPRLMQRAREAQPAWGAIPVRERCAYLRRLGEIVYQRRDEIAQVISTETGKPRVEAILAEVLLVLDLIRLHERNAPRWLRPERVPHSNPAMKTKKGWMQYEPLGVVGVISPWNFPFAIPMAEMIAAVAAGNAVLLKPSELTPWCGSLVGDLFKAATFPEGLVQVLQGGSDLGAALVKSRPDKMFFTGSVATGKTIAEACARQLIPSVLELGGKDAMIVLADARLDQAASAAVWGSLMNCGQACVSTERIYVEAPVAEEFTQRCLEKVRALKLGPSSDSETDVGPMIRPRQMECVEAQLGDAVERGAQILAGGRRNPEAGPSFWEPTVISGLNSSMTIMREETFGPVVTISRVADVEEAVALANASPFALSASVWTRDAQRGREIASRLRVGAVMINDTASYYGISAAPHGGRDFSGWGRTHSRLGLLEMVHVKYLDVERLPGFAKAWWFGYDAALETAADEFLQVLYAPRWSERWRALRACAPIFFRRMRGTNTRKSWASESKPAAGAGKSEEQ
jgi:succinate-semialdehyde dehydrogenase/glutarate-semialdehyde dehydrogenase